MFPDVIILAVAFSLGAFVGIIIWPFVTSDQKQRTQPVEAASQSRRSFADRFKGTAEIQEALKIIGQIAINHAGVENSLNYLLWQLRAYEYSTRNKQAKRPLNDVQYDLRQMRREAKKQLIVQKLKEVRDLLSKGRIEKRLDELGKKAEMLARWQELESRTDTLSNERNEVIHSGVSWSENRLMRKTGSVLDQEPLPINLALDNALAQNLGKLMIEFGVFTTGLGNILPFKSDDQIITNVAKIELKE
jgi:hypothetical protein